MKTKEVLALDEKLISKCITRVFDDLVIEKLKGNYVWDKNGKKYLDFSACVAVANIGHTNERVVKAVENEMKKGIHVGFSDFCHETPVLFANELRKFLPNHLNNFFFSNSGTEAVEAAYKCARWHSMKKYVVAFEGAFHGRTMGALSLTNSKPVQKDRFDPFLPVKHSAYAYCYRCKFGKEYGSCSFECLNALEKDVKGLKGDCAALFMEPVQGESGYVVPPKEFVQGVRKICDENDGLLVDDEIQAGCFRTGKFLAIENFNVKPDIVCLSKAIGGGLPLGVTAANRGVMDWVSGSHANTLGGNLLACAAGTAVLKEFKEKKLGENAARRGRELLKRMNELKERVEIIGDVRGLGLMIGIEIVKSKKSKKHNEKDRAVILNRCRKKGLLLLPAGKSVIRLCPPLTISREEAEKASDVLENELKRI